MNGVNALDGLILTRHGESTANVAYRSVQGTDVEEVGLPERDADIPLTDTGRRQAAALGRWLADLPDDERPTKVVTSPYLRARDTARIALAQTPFGPDEPGGLRIEMDERLRDREQGILEGLTPVGVRRRHPQEAARMQRLGKFYYRPPGGESWTDLALRLRSFYRDLGLSSPGARVLVVAHDAIVVMTRYIVEDLSEQEIMEIEKDPIGNCSVTRWRRHGGTLRPTAFNDCTHLLDADPAAR